MNRTRGRRADSKGVAFVVLRGGSTNNALLYYIDCFKSGRRGCFMDVGYSVKVGCQFLGDQYARFGK